jgi:hypothetical protein
MSVSVMFFFMVVLRLSYCVCEERTTGCMSILHIVLLKGPTTCIQQPMSVSVSYSRLFVFVFDCFEAVLC